MGGNYSVIPEGYNRMTGKSRRRSYSTLSGDIIVTNEKADSWEIEHFKLEVRRINLELKKALDLIDKKNLQIEFLENMLKEEQLKNK